MPVRNAIKKLKLSGRQTVRVDIYGLIADAVDSGLESGWNRAHKHTDTPEKQAIWEEQSRYIMNSICEYIRFDEALP